MLTFSVNPKVCKVHEAATAVLPNKPTVQFSKHERIGISEGFVKKAEGKLTEPTFNAGAFGFTVERNTKMTVIEREVALISSEEQEAGIRGLSEAYVQIDSFADDDTWLESLGLNVSIVKEVFEMVEDTIVEQETLKGKCYASILSNLMRTSLAGNGRGTSTLSRLIREYEDFSFLHIPHTNKVLIDFLKDVNSLGGFIQYILRHRKLGEALGLYDDRSLTA